MPVSLSPHHTIRRRFSGILHIVSFKFKVDYDTNTENFPNSSIVCIACASHLIATVEMTVISARPNMCVRLQTSTADPLHNGRTDASVSVLFVYLFEAIEWQW